MFLRPPFGWISNKVLQIVEDMGYRATLGDVHPRDSRQPGTEVILSRIFDRAGNGSIIILHDGGQWPRTDRRQSVEAVDRLTDTFTEKGYRFQTLSQLAGLS